MGKNKIQYEHIQDKRLRNITFNKRKNGLLKKAAEIALLCNIPIALFFGDVCGNLVTFVNEKTPNQLNNLFNNSKSLIRFTQEDYPNFINQKKGGNQYPESSPQRLKTILKSIHGNDSDQEDAEDDSDSIQLKAEYQNSIKSSKNSNSKQDLQASQLNVPHKKVQKLEQKIQESSQRSQNQQKKQAKAAVTMTRLQRKNLENQSHNTNQSHKSYNDEQESTCVNHIQMTEETRTAEQRSELYSNKQYSQRGSIAVNVCGGGLPKKPKLKIQIPNVNRELMVQMEIIKKDAMKHVPFQSSYDLNDELMTQESPAIKTTSLNPTIFHHSYQQSQAQNQPLSQTFYQFQQLQTKPQPSSYTKQNYTQLYQETLITSKAQQKQQQPTEQHAYVQPQQYREPLHQPEKYNQQSSAFPQHILSAQLTPLIQQELKKQISYLIQQHMTQVQYQVLPQPHKQQYAETTEQGVLRASEEKVHEMQMNPVKQDAQNGYESNCKPNQYQHGSKQHPQQQQQQQMTEGDQVASFWCRYKQQLLNRAQDFGVQMDQIDSPQTSHSGSKLAEFIDEGFNGQQYNNHGQMSFPHLEQQSTSQYQVLQ